MSSSRTMSLTAELVALCHREIADPGPSPDTKYLLDSDFQPAAVRLLDDKTPGPMWLFAYGSLIWKPEIPHVEVRRAVLHGWHRAFSMKIRRYRATADQPGYMMCLDHGGTCEGVVLRLAEEDLVGQFEKLLRREVSRQGGLEAVRWLDAETESGPVRALVFYAAPKQLEYYVENPPLEDVAAGLARACGHWGSGADYLFNTVVHLEEMGIHDAHLWRLQELVAAEIRSIFPAQA